MLTQRTEVSDLEAESGLRGSVLGANSHLCAFAVSSIGQMLGGAAAPTLPATLLVKPAARMLSVRRHGRECGLGDILDHLEGAPSPIFPLSADAACSLHQAAAWACVANQHPPLSFAYSITRSTNQTRLRCPI